MGRLFRLTQFSLIQGHYRYVIILLLLLLSFGSHHQGTRILAARRVLHQELLRVAGEWQGVLSSLALELLQVPREQWHSCKGVPAMVRNLVQEREAVLAFMHTVCDEVRVVGCRHRDEVFSRESCMGVPAMVHNFVLAFVHTVCDEVRVVGCN